MCFLVLETLLWTSPFREKASSFLEMQSFDFSIFADKIWILKTPATVLFTSVED
jgi:hypothetical protein